MTPSFISRWCSAQKRRPKWANQATECTIQFGCPFVWRTHTHTQSGIAVTMSGWFLHTLPPPQLQEMLCAARRLPFSPRQHTDKAVSAFHFACAFAAGFGFLQPFALTFVSILISFHFTFSFFASSCFCFHLMGFSFLGVFLWKWNGVRVRVCVYCHCNFFAMIYAGR